MRGLVAGLIVLFLEGVAEAVQEHSGVEGLVAHELAHLFLIVTSLAFSLSLIKIKPSPKSPLRYLALSGAFITLWSTTTFITHLLRPEKLADYLIVKSKADILWYTGAVLEHFILIFALYFFLKAVIRARDILRLKDVHQHSTHSYH